MKLELKGKRGVRKKREKERSVKPGVTKISRKSPAIRQSHAIGM
jgi:hypothetical protein